MGKKRSSIEHPIDAVEWQHRDRLTANNYNPNHVAPPEMELIIVSLLEDGWTAPIVVTPEGEIVDGFHRWTASKDLRVYKRDHGLVPTVTLEPKDKASQMMATIRHNRARGTHAVLEMSKIVQTMIEKDKLPMEAICARLQMEKEEVIRLAARAGIPETSIVKDSNWSSEWVPK